MNAEMNYDGLTVSLVRNSNHLHRPRMAGKGLLLLIGSFLVNASLSSPMVAQRKPIIVEDETIVLAGITKSVAKAEEVIGEQKAAESKTATFEKANTYVFAKLGL